ncbi:hypothetical protein MRX96_041289 [Rhipicephalus microplus]
MEEAAQLLGWSPWRHECVERAEAGRNTFVDVLVELSPRSVGCHRAHLRWFEWVQVDALRVVVEETAFKHRILRGSIVMALIFVMSFSSGVMKIRSSGSVLNSAISRWM